MGIFVLSPGGIVDKIAIIWVFEGLNERLSPIFLQVLLSVIYESSLEILSQVCQLSRILLIRSGQILLEKRMLRLERIKLKFSVRI